jgi:queuine tRNA-ribosyltransferase
MEYGADIVICLDDCTDVDQPLSAQIESVVRTVKWARRCKAEYQRRRGQQETPEPHPLLFGVVQGGGDRDLRKRCAEELLDTGFDGFGFTCTPISLLLHVSIFILYQQSHAHMP